MPSVFIILFIQYYYYYKVEPATIREFVFIILCSTIAGLEPRTIIGILLPLKGNYLNKPPKIK